MKLSVAGSVVQYHIPTTPPDMVSEAPLSFHLDPPVRPVELVPCFPTPDSRVRIKASK